MTNNTEVGGNGSREAGLISATINTHVILPVAVFFGMAAGHKLKQTILLRT